MTSRSGGSGREGRDGRTPARRAPMVSGRDSGGGRRSEAGERRRSDPAGGQRRARTGESAPPPPARKPWAADGELPRWIQEEVSRVTAKARIQPTIALLEEAAKAYAAARHGKAVRVLEEAKELSPRTATIRELLGLAAYRLGRWEQALRELRTFRRLTGETTHMPVEMDVLRALDRPADVEATWQSLRRIGGDRETEREGRVVYGAFLLDVGRDREAWEITNPKRLGSDPGESELRVWYVAARAAARLGDARTGRRLYEAIQGADPAFPGLDDLDRATR